MTLEKGRVERLAETYWLAGANAAFGDPGRVALMRLLKDLRVVYSYADPLEFPDGMILFTPINGRSEFATDPIVSLETLLGEHFSSEELRFAVSVVSRTADEWDDRLKQMFGGMTYQEMLKVQGNGETPPVKPGAGPPGFYL